MFALSGSASLLSSQRGRKMRCPYSCVALRNPWWYYKCMDYSKKHKLPPVPAGLSLSLCEYCFWFTLSFVPSACQRQSTNAHCICMYCMQWNRGDEAQGINPPVLISSPSVTKEPQPKSENPTPAGSLKVPATSCSGWDWCISLGYLWKLSAGRKGSSCQHLGGAAAILISQLTAACRMKSWEMFLPCSGIVSGL